MTRPCYTKYLDGTSFRNWVDRLTTGADIEICAIYEYGLSRKKGAIQHIFPIEFFDIVERRRLGGNVRPLHARPRCGIHSTKIAEIILS